MEYYKELQEITNTLEQVLKVFKKSYVLTTSSKHVVKDCIFVGIKGEHFNGNAFACQAKKQGAALCVVDDVNYYPLQDNQGYLLVDDSERFLQRFASYYRRTLNIPIIAISGTNGKTTTKELLHAVLSKKYITNATVGNLNNQLGVPMTLLDISPKTQVAIVEMGASHLGDIDFLCNIAEPDFALLTNIGTAHIEGFGSLEGVIKTKTELFRYVSSKFGVCFVNKDDANILKHKPLKSFTYSLSSKADVQAKILKNSSNLASIEYNGKKIHSNLVGSYNAYNILAALSVGLFFGVALEDIIDAIESYHPNNNRSQILKTQHNTLIMDCYNANPSSCQAALKSFEDIDFKDKCIFIGSMKELGSQSSVEHEHIVQIIKSMNLQQVIFVGKEYQPFAKGDNILWFEDSEKAKSFIEKHPINNSCILIKGSRATKMEVLADVL